MYARQRKDMIVTSVYKMRINITKFHLVMRLSLFKQMPYYFVYSKTPIRLLRQLQSFFFTLPKKLCQII